MSLPSDAHSANMSVQPDEVAANYQDALEDLVTNERYQILCLTGIAQENIEQAEAIARTLTAHIKKAPPARKLPALYVLDSLVKNIGTPYTVYFGANLHETFMLAYSQVDQAVRPKLEVMLNTWRKPVPGSQQTHPVFPLEATQSIVDALARYKAAAAQRPSQAAIRPQSIVQGQAVQYRVTPPPQPATQYQQPQIPFQPPAPTPQPQFHTPQYYQQPPQSTAYPQYQGYALQNHTPVQQQFPPFPIPPPNGHLPVKSNIDVRKLHIDIDDLTTDAKIDCMTHPMDQAKTKKLETLQSLKAFLDNGNLGEHDLRDVRDTITREMEKRNAEKLAAQHLHQPPTPQPSLEPPPQWQPLNPYQQHQQWPSVPPPLPQYQQPASQTPSFLGQANLADLLRHAQNKSTTQNGSAPVPAYVVPAASTPTVSAAVPALGNGMLSMLDQLRSSGALSKVATPLQGTTPPVPSAVLVDQVPFTSSSMKIPRPHLVLKFINEKPNQCSTCGKRFTSEDVGRAKKEKHLDWHFKTKTRSLEAEQRGQNRSWYVDEHEWIASKEYEDDLGLEDPAAATNGLAAPNVVREIDYVRTPSDPAYRNAVCPIDQEPFKSEWSGEIQDFIWRDAVKVGDRYYHASCYKEAMKLREVTQPARAGTPLASAGLGHRRTATPDSVLGKRKAEDDEPNSAIKSRLKIEA